MLRLRVAVWVAFVASPERCGCLSGWHAMELQELPSTKQSENVVEVCLGGMHHGGAEECSIRRPAV